jgi:hypothetical protein
MPSDALLEIDPERLDRYVAVLQAIEDDRGGTQEPLDCRLVAAVIAAFGPGDGFEAYWSALHLIESAHCTETERLIRQGLTSDSVGTRNWCCLLVGRKRAPADVPLLLARLMDPETVVVAEALKALRMIACNHPIPDAAVSVSALTTHPDPQIARKAQETLLLIT